MEVDDAPLSLGGGEGAAASEHSVAGEVGCSRTVRCTVKYGETKAKGCWVGIKSVTLILMVALRTWILVPGPGKTG